MGRLDIGALVAVIAAYKDLPSPVKELIDWDQQRLDVEVKYQQVMEQFLEEEVAPPELQALVDKPQLPSRAACARRILRSSTSPARASSRRLRGCARPARGDRRTPGLRGEQARAAPRPSSLSFERLGRDRRVDITRAPEAVTGRSIGYVGSPAYLFPARVRDNILYGLKNRPVRLLEERSPDKAFEARARPSAPATPRWTSRPTGWTTRPRAAPGQRISTSAWSSSFAWWTSRKRSSSSGCAAAREARRRRRRRARARRAPPHARAAASPGYRGLGRALRSGDVQPQRHARREPALRHAGPARLRHGKPGGERVCTSGAA